MKRLLNDDILVIDIDVFFSLKTDDIALVATDVLPLRDANMVLDDYSHSNYVAFVENVEEIIDYYGFKKKIPHSSETSYYGYYAHESQLATKNVPRYIKLRISDHEEQPKSEKHLEDIRHQTKITLDKLKLPKSKKRQRYMLQYITVNETTHDTYESALNDVEDQIRNWFILLGIDISPYDDLGDWN